MADLEAISICLGDKHYMMGSTPCPVDCSAFGFLAVLFYLYPEDFFFRKEAEEKFPNLKSYTERIKKTYWEDWDDLLSKEKQKWRNNWLDSDQTNTLNPWYKTFWMPIISCRDLMLGPKKCFFVGLLIPCKNKKLTDITLFACFDIEHLGVSCGF